MSMGQKSIGRNSNKIEYQGLHRLVKMTNFDLKIKVKFHFL